MLLHHMFINIAKKYKKKIAFVDCTIDKRITYEKALIATLLLSDHFKRLNSGFVGVMLPTSAGCGLTILGLLMAGRTPVMINYSTGAENNAKYAQKKCGFKTIITSKALLDKINCPFVDGMVFLEDIMNSISVGAKIKSALKAKMPSFMLLNSVYRGSNEDNAVILFTSGSEKTPKAVQLTHKNIYSNIKSFSAVYDLNSNDSMLANLPLFHVFGLTVNFWTPVYHGMTMITYANPLEYKTISNIIKKEKPTILVGTPSFLMGYLKVSNSGDFKSLRYVISGADKCPQSIRDGYIEKHGITVYEGYGTTETSPVISVNPPGKNKPGSIGKPIPNVQVKIEDYETAKECEPGKIGRIMVKGDLVMKGYLDDFEETSMRIRQGWYDTGDMGYIDEDGYLWHAGRLRRFVKIGGEMVSLVKVEDELQQYLPPHVECCVVEIPDAVKGYKIVAVTTKKIDERKTLKLMSKNLPNIALPKEFVVIDELPKMGSGKIDFRKVTEMVNEIFINNK